MMCRWNGVRCVTVTWFLFALNGPSSTEIENRAGAGYSPNDPLRSTRDRLRRHSPINTTSTSRRWAAQCSPQCSGNISAQLMKRNYRLDSVRDDILRKLRMRQPPNVTGRIPNVPAMQNLLNQMNGDMNAPEHSYTDDMNLDRLSPAKFILLSQMVPPERRANLATTCYFTFSSDIMHDQVISANMGIYLKLRNTTSHTPQSTAPVTWLLIYRIFRDPDGRFQTALQRKRKIFLTPQDTGKWQYFDVRTIVEHWIRNPEQNYGVQIIASDFRGEPLATLPTANQTEDVLRPFIEIQILNQSLNRRRRSTEFDCVEASADPRCCRYPLTIDFEAFRWDWVIAPKRYEAYYCSGDCPLLFNQRNTHTHVISQIIGGLGVPCCAPTLLTSLQMIYIDGSHNVVLGTLPGMIVERCGCS